MNSFSPYCRWIPVVSLLIVGIWAGSCDDKPVNKPVVAGSDTYFQSLDAATTGIDFINEIRDNHSFNALTYRNFYNGGGVSIGDINNDSLPDLYFTANLGPNRLYLNKGNFQFEDITDRAGVSGTKGWSTGATMTDINGDGWLDIYVSNSGDLEGADKENELFLNQGDLTFSEQAADYGLNNLGYSTQASFFDYDLDGDLDCYLLNNSFREPGKIELFKSMRDKPDVLAGDKLYRNDGGSFTDVTIEAGIYSSEIGFGLGAAISDVNNDLLPDIYVSNDFWERDYLYLNQGDGTFSEELIDRISMCSISSMGGDIADLNNDGYPEIISTDMLAADNYRIKAMSNFDPYHLEDLKYRANYHYQMAQNCLHLNDGSGKFQEIGFLSGVAATDWSWGALIFDFDNDGNKDLFVSNGIWRDLMYLDFRDFLADNDVYRAIATNEELDYPTLINQMPSNPLKNFAFRNTGNLRFRDEAQKLGLDTPSFSNGSAYGDLDNDGDFDLVVNNVNMPAFVYRNEADTRLDHHYLKIELKGYASNPFGIGARVDIETAAGKQTLQNFNSRGFESSIEPSLLFGLGKETQVSQLLVIWPDKKTQRLTGIAADQTLVLDYSEASAGEPFSTPAPAPVLYEEVSKQALSDPARHVENVFNDFDTEILLLKMLSKEGPRVLTADVNGDKREDFLLLGAAGDEDKLYLQNANGTFLRKRMSAFRESKDFESTCGAFFDYDGDGDMDLMLGSGGNEVTRDRKYFILRYYQNDGKGGLVIDNRNIPQIVGNFSTLEAADIEGDGDMDLFIGGRLVPGNYGLPPRSFLFVNDNGKWIEDTPPELAGVGMVTDATWADTDGDSDLDLVVVGDWMSVHIFPNNQGRIEAPLSLPNSQGWWNRIETADLDKDGDMDFVLGNWGLNTKFKASLARPLTMYVNDFDQNGKSEFIINWYPPLNNQAFPFATKPDLTAQLPSLRKSILKYESYAQETYQTMIPPAAQQTAIPYRAHYLQSAILWNDNNQFNLTALPIEAQVAPAYGIVAEDLNGDGHTDIWLGGNCYSLKPQVGRQDANKGVFLAGDGSRNFRFISPAESGIYLSGEVRDATVIQRGDVRSMIVVRNNEEALLFQKR